MFPLFFYSGQGLSGHQFSYVQKDEIQVLIGEEAFQTVEWDKVQINNKLKGFDFLLSSISFVLQTTSMISYNNYLYIWKRKKEYEAIILKHLKNVNAALNDNSKNRGLM